MLLTCCSILLACPAPSVCHLPQCLASVSPRTIPVHQLPRQERYPPAPHKMQQAMWYELASGRAYLAAGSHGRALKRFLKVGVPFGLRVWWPAPFLGGADSMHSRTRTRPPNQGQLRRSTNTAQLAGAAALRGLPGGPV